MVCCVKVLVGLDEDIEVCIVSYLGLLFWDMV